VKLKVVKIKEETQPKIEKSPFKDKPLCETLLDLQLTEDEKKLLYGSSTGNNF